MAVVISVSNQKGGVGKTTSSYALASVFTNFGYKVLSIDLDGQGNLTFALNADAENSKTSYDVFCGDDIEEAIQHTHSGDIVPANILLSSVELEFTERGREFILKKAIEKVRNKYDIILIDSPPALSILTINAFTASDCVLVPMQADIFSLQGLAQLYDTISRVQKYCNPNLKFAGMFLTRLVFRTNFAKEVRETAQMIADSLHIPLLQTQIRNSVTICEAQSRQINPMEDYSASSVMLDYCKLVNELIENGILRDIIK